jgi:two-component system, cell cycle sensor histidine kinase and response regulator CckA
MGPREKTSILLVDDEETDLSQTRNALEAAGFSVLTATEYSTGLSVFESQPDRIDLLIADIALPDGNGCDLALAMLARQPSLRVLFISGHVGSEVCRFYGLDIADLHFLRKPFTAPALVSRVREVLAANVTPFRRQKPMTSTSASD